MAGPMEGAQMANPVTARPTSKRYLGNSDPDHLEVHDLQGENTNCQIDEIIAAGNAVTFSPDTLAQAHYEGYDNCAYCLGASPR
jgi:hypothetical protein